MLYAETAVSNSLLSKTLANADAHEMATNAMHLLSAIDSKS